MHEADLKVQTIFSGETQQSGNWRWLDRSVVEVAPLYHVAGILLLLPITW